MIIQAGRRSALMVALAAVAALSVAGAGPSLATTPDTRTGAIEIAAADWPASSSTTSATERSFGVQGTTAAAGQSELQTVSGEQPAEAASDPASTQQVTAVSNDDSSGWDKASIIGKIFIACGTLLTLGSAARMFML